MAGARKQALVTADKLIVCPALAVDRKIGGAKNWVEAVRMKVADLEGTPGAV